MMVGLMHDLYRTMQRHAAERQQLAKTFHVGDRVVYQERAYIVYGHALIDDAIWAKLHQQDSRSSCICVKEVDLSAFVL